MTYKGYTGSVEYSDADKVLCGRVLNVDGVVSYEAEDVRGIETAFRQAVDDYIEYCRRHGKEPQKPVSGRFTLRMSPELHRRALAVASLRRKSLNAVITETLAATLAET